MTPATFYRLSWREFVQARLGWLRQRSHDFEHTRAFCYAIYCANRASKQKPPSIDKFWPLPTDRKRSAKAIKLEENRYKALIKETREKFRNQGLNG